MTRQHSTPNSFQIKSIEIVYHVADRRGAKAVTVQSTGDYSCQCDVFALYGECGHADAVRARRRKEGRKF